MRLILWTIGCIFAAAGLVQIAIEAMLAAFGGSWTRLLSLSDVVEAMFGAGSADWMPQVVADSPPWITALVLGLIFLFLGRFRKPTQSY